MKKLFARILTAAMVVGLLSVSAFAYTAEVSELDTVTPSNSYVEVSTCTHYDGEHPLYIFPAGTTFQVTGYLVVQAWKIESETEALDFYDSDYSSGSDGATFVPEPGVIYMVQESNQMDWFQYMYIMVEGGSAQPDPEPEPEPEPETVAGFQDVPVTAWYAGYVETVVDKGLFSGKGEGTFGPEDSMTYAEFLVVLSQFSGESIPGAAGAWYQGYVNWAEGAGLIPDEMQSFDPDAPITRQDMAALFGTFLDTYAHDGSTVNSGNASFTDGGSIADYAADGVQTCYELGIMSGKDGNAFDPLGTATRAEVAVTMTQMARVMER